MAIKTGDIVKFNGSEWVNLPETGGGGGTTNIVNVGIGGIISPAFLKSGSKSLGVLSNFYAIFQDDTNLSKLPNALKAEYKKVVDAESFRKVFSLLEEPIPATGKIAIANGNELILWLRSAKDTSLAIKLTSKYFSYLSSTQHGFAVQFQGEVFDETAISTGVPTTISKRIRATAYFTYANPAVNIQIFEENDEWIDDSTNWSITHGDEGTLSRLEPLNGNLESQLHYRILADNSSDNISLGGIIPIGSPNSDGTNNFEFENGDLQLVQTTNSTIIQVLGYKISSGGVRVQLYKPKNLKAVSFEDGVSPGNVDIQVGNGTVVGYTVQIQMIINTFKTKTIKKKRRYFNRRKN